MKAIFSFLAAAFCAISPLFAQTPSGCFCAGNEHQALCPLYPLFAQAPAVQRQNTVDGNNKKFFRLSFDGKNEKCLRLGIGTLLTSDKYYPEFSLAFNQSVLGIGGSVGKIFSRTPFNDSNNLGWHFSLSLFTKINLTDSKIFAVRPGLKADFHTLSVIDKDNKITYTIVSPFVGFDIVPLKGLGINYQIQFPLYAKSDNSNSEVNHSTMLHTISLVCVIPW